jgi:NB-ARC domain/Rx N-terminal domain
MFLSAVISTLTEKTTDILLQEFTTEHGVEQHHQKLCRILLALQDIIADAEERSQAEPIVRRLLHDLKALLYEAADVLDDMRYDAISKVVESEICSEKKTRPSLSLPGSYLIRYSNESISNGKRLKGVLEKIEAIVTEMNQFRFLMARKPVITIDRPWSHSNVVELAVIGRTDELEKIVAIVLSHAKAEKEHVTVFSIVGVGGSGKTTLAQLVCDDVRIQNYFQLTLSAHISDEFDLAHIAKSIIVSEDGFDNLFPVDGMDRIRCRLHQLLSGKRYLLLLDNISNKNQVMLEQMKHLLDCGRPGSTIIVTTRNQIVSNLMGAIATHIITPLNQDHLWASGRAFQMGVQERPEMVEIGKKLIKKCCGSPLLAIILGGLMSFKQKESEWLDILESNIWENADVGSVIMPLLQLSYFHLPSYMKRCFAFSTIFPKGYEIERDILIQLWMANDFVPSEGNMEIEEKGIEIFNELAWRGFFQFVKKKKETAGLWGI